MWLPDFDFLTAYKDIYLYPSGALWSRGMRLRFHNNLTDFWTKFSVGDKVMTGNSEGVRWPGVVNNKGDSGGHIRLDHPSQLYIPNTRCPLWGKLKPTHREMVTVNNLRLLQQWGSNLCLIGEI